MSGSSWRRLHVGLFGLLALQGLGWALLGSFDPWGWWDGHLAQALFGREALLPAEEQVKRAVLIPLGATDAGFFLLAALFAARAERAGERYVIGSLGAAVGLWFVADSALSVWGGIGFNALFVNVPVTVLLAVLLAGWWRAASPAGAPH